MSPSIPQLRVLGVELRVLAMRTRFPFRYGIASFQSVPHLFVAVEVEIDGQTQTGLSSDGLPPKWFTKNPRSTTRQDLEEMISVVQNAARIATVHSSRNAQSFFLLWRMLQKEVGSWGFKQGHPPLLYQFGVSLIERAVLDALCKSLDLPLHQLIKTPAMDVDWSIIHPGLQDHSAADFLPSQPLQSTFARHTVGLGDPIHTADIPDDEVLNDGLPQSLEEVILTYGVRYFKIKVGGDVMADIARLGAITEVITHHRGKDFSVTLDGNESFQSMADFRGYFARIAKEEQLAPLLKNLLWVEQPIHRSRALQDEVGAELQAWTDAPPLIIDESDGAPGDGHKALKLGYSGVSHKNCKGIIKGLANAALIHHHRRLRPKRHFVLSGEDLVNVGPVALTQDLAMMALLGIEHVERNGHHYFRGLTMYSNELATLTAQAHPDLYDANDRGFVKLNINEGKLSLRSVNEAPFGCGVEPDLNAYPLVKDWIAAGGLEAVTA